MTTIDKRERICEMCQVIFPVKYPSSKCRKQIKSFFGIINNHACTN